jgi:hypothetical protein
MTSTTLERQAEEPSGETVMPLPIVEWTTVVKADDPIREPTRGRLRELRKKQHVSEGVTVYRRGKRGLEGRSTYYSVLAAFAARSRREGHDDEALEFERGASLLEAEFAARLETYLSRHSLSQLPQADFFPELTTATARELARWDRLINAVLAVARVDEIAGDIAHLEGTSPRGTPVAVDLPRALLERQSLTTGDRVWVFSRVVGDAAVVEVLPAIRVQVRLHPHDVVHSWLPVFVDTARHEPAPADGLTDAERAEFAEEFAATVDADLSAEDLTGLRADLDAGRIAVRRLRPAG